MDHDAIFEVSDRPLPASLVGYNKIASIFEICQLGLPTLRTLVVAAWSETIACRVEDYIRQNGWSQVMIRSDRRPEVPNSPRGGFLFDLKSCIAAIGELIASGRVVLVVEPANKYDNLYGINVLFDSSEDVMLEVVGPGFDATDINRGDISPHERIYLAVKNKTVTTRLFKRETVTPDDYLASVSQRLFKIGREVTQRTSSTSGVIQESLEEVGSQFLSLNGCVLLNRHRYTPLPRSYLGRLVSYIQDLPWRLPASGVDARYVLSLSILNQSGPRFVFWDIVRPLRKYG